MFETFSDRARRVVVLAQEECRLLDHNYIGTEHLLLGLLHEGEGIGIGALEAMGISPDVVRQRVQERVERGPTVASGHIPFTPSAKRVLELSTHEATAFGRPNIDTEHLLLALIREGDGVAAQVLTALGADLNRTRSEVLRLTAADAGPPTVETAEAAAFADRLARVERQLAATKARLDAMERRLGK